MEIKSIKQNFLMNAALSISGVLFPLILHPYVSRCLLPAGMGKVSFAQSFVAYFKMAAMLGIPNYGVRECAKARDDRESLSRVARELLAISLALSSLSFAALFLCTLSIPRLAEDAPLFLALGLNIILTSIGMEWLYMGLEQYGYITVRSLSFRLLSVLLIFALVRSPRDYLLYAALSTLIPSAPCLFNFLHSRLFLSSGPVPGFRPSRHLASILVFFGITCAVTVYNNLDEVMLGFMRGDSAVGYYHIGVGIELILTNLATAFGVVLLPRLSNHIAKGEIREFNRLTTKALRYELLFSTAASLYFILFARESIDLIYGPAYEKSVLPMQIMMPAMLISSTTKVIGNQILIPSGREKIVLHSVMAGAAVDLIINLLLIPHFAEAGAAVGTVAAEAAVLVWQFVYLRPFLSGIFSSFFRLPLLLSLGLASAASLWVKLLSAPHFLKLLISSVCFFGTYCLIEFLSGDEATRELLGICHGAIGRHLRGPRG